MHRMALPDDPGPPPVGRHSRVGMVAGVAVTLIAVALAIAFGVSRQDDPGRIVLEVVATHDQGSDRPPPSPIPDPGPRDGFADFAARAHWEPSGAREDSIEGRTAATIFWDRAGRRVAYTAISGDPVNAPATRAAPAGGASCCGASTSAAARR